VSAFDSLPHSIFALGPYSLYVRLKANTQYTFQKKGFVHFSGKSARNVSAHVREVLNGPFFINLFPSCATEKFSSFVVKMVL